MLNPNPHLTPFLEPNALTIPNGSSIGSAVFTRLIQHSPVIREAAMLLVTRSAQNDAAVVPTVLIGCSVLPVQL